MGEIMNGLRSEELQGAAAAVCMAGAALATGGGDAAQSVEAWRAGTGKDDGRGRHPQGVEQQAMAGSKQGKDQRQEARTQAAGKAKAVTRSTGSLGSGFDRLYAHDQPMKDAIAKARAYYSLPSLYP